MKTAMIHARIEPQMKQKAESILKKLGITPTEAIRIFYNQISLRKGLPFSVEVPNKLTQETMRKTEKGIDLQAFDSVDEMFASWES